MSTYYYPENDYRNYLEHHGIPGMKWGVRRFQNKDGSLTSAGKKHAKSLKSRVLGKLAYTYDDNFDIVKNAQRTQMGRQNKMQRVVNNAIATKNAKGASGKITEFVGSGAKRTRLNTDADYKERLAKTYLNDKKRGNLEREARNLRREADYYDKKAKNYSAGGKKALKQAARDIFLGSYDKMKIPYEKANGKVVSRGRAKLEEALKGAVTTYALNTALEVANKRIKKISV